MNLPVSFPSDADVIREEVARFRALSPENRMRSLRSLLAAGALTLRQAPKAVLMEEYALEQENLARQTVKEFIARHGG
jgi:hypothetical protein